MSEAIPGQNNVGPKGPLVNKSAWHGPEFDDYGPDDDWGELEEPEKEYVPLSDPITLAQAKELVVEYFEQYKPDLLDADSPLHNLVAKLDGHFSGDDWDGYFAKTLKPAVVELVLPILEDIKEEMPQYENATSRFKKLYCPLPQEPWSPELAESLANQPADPYQSIGMRYKLKMIKRFTSPESPV